MGHGRNPSTFKQRVDDDGLERELFSSTTIIVMSPREAEPDWFSKDERQLMALL
jgi:hypothetical protein